MEQLKSRSHDLQEMMKNMQLVGFCPEGWWIIVDHSGSGGSCEKLWGMIFNELKSDDDDDDDDDDPNFCFDFVNEI